MMKYQVLGMPLGSVFAAGMLMLGACAPQDLEPPHTKARFSSYPRDLLGAFESACTGPANLYSEPADGVAECREYLPPDPTAALILQYDGTPEDLPQMVIQLRTRADTPGFLVEHDVYLNVPQKTGADIQIREYDTELHRTLEQVFIRAGGVPE